MQLHDSKVSIPISRLKIIFLLLYCACCTAVFAWGIYISCEPNDIPIVLRLIGFAGVSLFGLPGSYIVFKLFDPKPGLILDATGIIDNSSAASVGRILWQDIKKIEVQKTGGRNQHLNLLRFYLSNPQKYLQRGGFYQKQINVLNYKISGSPIHITSNTLKISFSKLTELIFQYYDRYGRNKSS